MSILFFWKIDESKLDMEFFLQEKVELYIYS